MERLTQEDLTKACNDTWDYCGLDGVCQRDCWKPTPCKMPNMVHKLAEYEDTGLTPEEVTQTKKENAELKELLRLAITDLHYLSQCSESGFVCFKCSYHTDGHRGCKSECEYRWDKCDRAREVGVEV